jgi:hypothetical protein
MDQKMSQRERNVLAAAVSYAFVIASLIRLAPWGSVVALLITLGVIGWAYPRPPRLPPRDS